MMGRTFSSTKRPTESWIMRSSSVSSPRRSYRSKGFSMAAVYRVSCDPQRRPAACLEGDAESSIDVRHQPDRADQQELHVLEEGGAGALDGVPDELPDPRRHEDHQAGGPERPGQGVQPAHDEEHADQAQRGADAERRRQEKVVGDPERDTDRGPV